MRIILLVFGSLISVQAMAFPVVTDQAIFRDDKDANLYYFHPERMVLASDPATKIKRYGCFENGPTAIVNGGFSFEMSEQLKQSFAEIKKTNPNAKIAALSFKTTQFLDKHVTNVSIACGGEGISVGALAACTWQLSGAHACSAFKAEAAKAPGINILDLSFTFRGMVQGQLKDVTRTIPVLIFDVN